jgi:hypothetical protein
LPIEQPIGTTRDFHNPSASPIDRTVPRIDIGAVSHVERGPCHESDVHHAVVGGKSGVADRTCNLAAHRAAGEHVGVDEARSLPGSGWDGDLDEMRASRA